MIADLFILDTSPLGLVTTPKESPDGRRCKAWMRQALIDGTRVQIPAVADYEVRRELVRATKLKGLARLDIVTGRQGIFPADDRVWRRAAEFWALTRQRGKPTAKDDAIDADMLIAATANVAAEDGISVIVVTDNIGHLGLFCDARDWRALAP